MRFRLWPYTVRPRPEDYELDTTFTPSGRWDDPHINHLYGIPWHDADLPPWRHKCWAQTTGFVGFDLVRRCACGAYGSRDVWLERNSRRREAIRQQRREWAEQRREWAVEDARRASRPVDPCPECGATVGRLDIRSNTTMTECGHEVAVTVWPDRIELETT